MLLDSVPIPTAGLVVALTGLLFFLKGWAFPNLDRLEPPLLKPRVPIIGHMVSMIREKASFYTRLFKEHAMPICTVPMLNGKMYIINSPSLIQSALRNNDISFEPFLIELPKTMFGLNENQINLLSQERVMKELLGIIHSTLLGEPLHRLNVTALTRLAKHLNCIKPGFPLRVTDSFLWIRDITTEATARALFGEKNPISEEHVPLLWAFDKQAAMLAVGVAPNVIARDALVARGALNKLLTAYYEARHDEGSDVSDVVRKRASVFRREGWNTEEISLQELVLPWVGTTNTIPTLFWLFLQLFSRPNYLARVRAEVEAITAISDGPEGKTATIDSSKLEKHCNVLNACYQETLRVYLHSVGNRRIVKDTKIQDSEGREYLLKKGINVQWPPMVTHFLNSVWGDDADKFNPERFVDATTQDERSRRGALLPFGGGRHLCPGRKFAFTEILGFVGAVALGFEVDGLSLPDSSDPGIGTAARGAAWGTKDPGFSLSRRPGWENVTWAFA